MAKPDVADLIATEIQDWLEVESTAIAEAILGSALAPAVVQPPRSEAVAYWRSVLYNPDGTPNPVGRDVVMRRYGPTGYEAVALAAAGEPIPLEQFVPGGA